eukprot:2547324-Rhodomonas_salina.1
MSAFFQPQVAPVFDKQQDRLSAGLGDDDESPAAAGSSQGGAAAGVQSQQQQAAESITIEDDDGAGQGYDTEDNATESEGKTSEKPHSSTDTDASA